MIRVVIPFYRDFEAPKEGLRSMRAAEMEFQLSAHQGPLIYVARNRGINDGKSQKRVQDPVSGPTHFLFVDADIGFDVEHVRALLALKKPIAACPYRCHDRPELYQCGELSLLGIITGKDPITATGVHARSYIGAGFLLVERNVFRHLAYPWFHHRMIEKYDTREQCGEDVGFCLAAREAGFPIHVDFDHPVEHQLRTADQFALEF
jgi:hypothetical protein